MRSSPPPPTSSPITSARQLGRLTGDRVMLMLAIPLSGLALAVAAERPLPFVGELEISDALDDSDVEDVFEGGHIATHLAFFAAFTLHIGLVIKHQLLDRDGLLRRIL